MARICEDNSLSIGNTPLVRYNRVSAGLSAAIVVKSVPPDSVVVGIPGRVTHRKDTSRMIQYENGSVHILELEPGAMPDTTGRALRH